MTQAYFTAFHTVLKLQTIDLTNIYVLMFCLLFNRKTETKICLLYELRKNVCVLVIDIFINCLINYIFKTCYVF